MPELHALIIFLQIQAGIHLRHLFGVAIEHLGFHLGREQSAETGLAGDAALLGLAPAGMADVGIDVGIKTVFVGCLDVPCGRRFFFEKIYFDNGFDGLETVFSGHHEA